MTGIAVQDARIDANDWLVENGYTFGYATYWNANVNTVLTEKKLEYCALAPNSVTSPFFGGMQRKYYKHKYHEGKTFILLNRSEVLLFQDSLPAGYQLVYTNTDYVVYSYTDNPYNFELSLFNYFPIMGEDIELEGNFFYSQGSVLNERFCNDPATDSFLIYGPYISKLPIDGVYDIDFCINIKSAKENGIGYVGVTSENGTKTLSQTGIICSEPGEKIISLKNVKISKDAENVEFPIYIYKGNEAEFMYIKIRRVQ